MSGSIPWVPHPDELHFQRRRCLDQFFRWLRACAVCRTIRPPIDLLCGHCRGRLLAVANRGNELRREGYPFPVYSLWTWDNENDALLKPVLHSFKGGFAFSFAALAAEVLVNERSPNLLRRPIFLFPRSARVGAREHAWLLARLFASFWPDRALICGLIASQREGGGQKTKTLFDRSRHRFIPLDREKISWLSDEAVTWIFVDDVITSGATALAAFMAAGEPPSFEVWTLASRPKLAGKSRL